MSTSQDVRLRTGELVTKTDYKLAFAIACETADSLCTALESAERRVKEARSHLPYFAGWNASTRKYEVCHWQGRDANVVGFTDLEDAWREAERRSKLCLPPAPVTTEDYANAKPESA